MQRASSIILDTSPNEPRQLPAPAPTLSGPVFADPKLQICLYQGDCLDVLPALPEDSVDLIFADPPYFLSNGGVTYHAGRMVSVNKGDWDRSRGADANHESNRAWLATCRRVLKPNGTIWVSGTAHVIHVDRSRSRTEHGMTSRPLTKLMQQERMFYFVGAVEREVIFSVTARTMEEAWERFCNSPKAGKDVFCVIKTETEIYLAVGK